MTDLAAAAVAVRKMNAERERLHRIRARYTAPKHARRVDAERRFSEAMDVAGAAIAKLPDAKMELDGNFYTAWKMGQMWFVDALLPVDYYPATKGPA
jgi:hypothetical protein